MDDPSWAVLIPAHYTPTALNMWNGRPVQFLIPATDGSALLWWEFDVRDLDTVVGVVVHLTEDEAQTVFETPATVGLLERVRQGLSDTEAAVFVFGAGKAAHRLITIPRTGSEEDFIDYLLDESDLITENADSDDLLGLLAASA